MDRTQETAPETTGPIYELNPDLKARSRKLTRRDALKVMAAGLVGGAALSACGEKVVTAATELKPIETPGADETKQPQPSPTPKEPKESALPEAQPATQKEIEEYRATLPEELKKNTITGFNIDKPYRFITDPQTGEVIRAVYSEKPGFWAQIYGFIVTDPNGPDYVEFFRPVNYTVPVTVTPDGKPQNGKLVLAYSAEQIDEQGNLIIQGEGAQNYWRVRKDGDVHKMLVQSRVVKPESTPVSPIEFNANVAQVYTGEYMGMKVEGTILTDKSLEPKVTAVKFAKTQPLVEFTTKLKYEMYKTSQKYKNEEFLDFDTFAAKVAEAQKGGSYPDDIKFKIKADKQWVDAPQDFGVTIAYVNSDKFADKLDFINENGLGFGIRIENQRVIILASPYFNGDFDVNRSKNMVRVLESIKNWIANTYSRLGSSEDLQMIKMLQNADVTVTP